MQVNAQLCPRDSWYKQRAWKIRASNTGERRSPSRTPTQPLAIPATAQPAASPGAGDAAPRPAAQRPRPGLGSARRREPLRGRGGGATLANQGATSSEGWSQALSGSCRDKQLAAPHRGTPLLAALCTMAAVAGLAPSPRRRRRARWRALRSRDVKSRQVPGGRRSARRLRGAQCADAA